MNTVTKESIEAKIKHTAYHILEGTTTTVCSVTLTCGFVAVGLSACVDPANFNKETGEKYSREQAIDSLWELEGYLLAHKLAGEV